MACIVHDLSLLGSGGWQTLLHPTLVDVGVVDDQLVLPVEGFHDVGSGY